jgi:hypothetical protein
MDAEPQNQQWGHQRPAADAGHADEGAHPETRQRIEREMRGLKSVP